MVSTHFLHKHLCVSCYVLCAHTETETFEQLALNNEQHLKAPDRSAPIDNFVNTEKLESQQSFTLFLN